MVQFCVAQRAPCDLRVKMATGVSDEDYVCTLTEMSAQKAKEELNEDPKNRLGAVQKFRELVLQQPHIKCPTGGRCNAFCSSRVSRSLVFHVNQKSESGQLL